MPRRKQQAPQRSVAYGPDDNDFKDPNKTLPEDEHLQDDGLSLDGQEGEYLFNDDEDLADHFSCQNSPLSNGTNPDAGYASPLSNSSEQLADLKTPPPAFQEVQEEKPAPAMVLVDKPVVVAAAAAAAVVVEGPEPANGLSLQDSLEQMKAVYANLISEASWSSIALDMLKSKQGNNLRASTHNGRNHKGSNGFLSTSGSSSHSQGNVHVKTSSSSNNNHHSSGNASMSSTNTTTTSSSMNTSTATSHSNSNSMSNNNSGGVAYDWHQAALAKTLQHTPYHLLPEPSLFSTVQLYRQNNKLYGPVFTGASKFRCKDCSAAYDTLVGLTVHMNESGHYRDDNKDKEDDRGKRWSKPRKRSLMEMEGKEDAQKVLKCMYCGHSFESLQDLSVHMIKTKHYQKVPLKEPMPALTSKLVPPSKKRPFQELVTPSSPESGSSCVPLGETPKETQKLVNPYVTANNRYGYQNGASYTWQFEARKAQILKCMECGSSHDTLQQLTAHMMVTGHFLKVTNSASKKGKQLVFDPVVEEKFQSVALPPTTTRLPAPNGKPDSPTRPQTPQEEKKEEEPKQEEMEEESMEIHVPEKKIKEEKEDPSEKSEKAGKNRPHKYLTEADLEEAPKGGVDILKSLENAVSSAISKAQTGAPTWGGYTSIHAAYQLHGALKSTFSSCAQVQPLFSTTSMKVLSSDVGSLIHSPNSPSPPPNRRSNMLAMEELVEKVTGKSSVKKEWEESQSERKCKSVATKSPSPPPREKQVSPKQENLFKPAKRNTLEDRTEFRDKVGEVEDSKMDMQVKSEAVSPEVAVSNGCNKLGIITDHSPEQPLVNPLSALQSIMNNHLGKAAKVSTPFTDPFSMLHKLNNHHHNSNNSNNNNNNNTTTAEKPLPSSVPAKQKEPPSLYHGDEDQPMDLTKSKNANGSTGNGTSPPLNNSHVNSCKRANVANHYPSLSPPLRENALMDISDMVKNLTGRLTPKSTTPSSTSEKSDMDSSVFDEGNEDLSPIQRRKGRQSNWNPQHLLILQAQFASSLRDTPEGKLIITDLGPQERVHICKFTGLSMTTISHWLANVKYQLKRTGSTKFLKNIDTSHPLFLCSDCASQYRTPSSYIAHLESHLGFTLKDLSKLSIDLLGQHAVRIAEKTFSSLGLTEEDTGSILQCKLCSRTFVSKHAIKLHLCKSHGKSPEDHLIFVKEMEKTDKL